MSLVIGRSRVANNGSEDLSSQDQKNFLSYKRGTIIISQGKK
jgi:hypothetical protein